MHGQKEGVLMIVNIDVTMPLSLLVFIIIWVVSISLCIIQIYRLYGKISWLFFMIITIMSIAYPALYDYALEIFPGWREDAIRTVISLAEVALSVLLIVVYPFSWTGLKPHKK